MTNKIFELNCPLPLRKSGSIQLAHGGGGSLTQKLIDEIFMEAFRNDYLEARHDGAVFEAGNQRFAFTTDSFVVRPLFFPGGDIGKLAVCGTVNDLAMCGARPLYLSAGFILEEGFPVESLKKIVESMKKAAQEAGVQIVTGDTKVVDKGKGDGVFINTAGIGILEHHYQIGPAQIQPGDAVILSGDIGRHGIAIMAEREGLAFETQIESDCAVLSGLTQKLWDAGIEIHCMRDLTRGGLASAANELAQARNAGIFLSEAMIPVTAPVRGACEILGLDPLYVANEGRFMALVAEKDAVKTLEILQQFSPEARPAVIGKVTGEGEAHVLLENLLGTTRILDLLPGEQLPRIC